MTVSTNDPLQNALEKIQEQYLKGQQIIDKMQQDGEDIEKLEKDIAFYKEYQWFFGPELALAEIEEKMVKADLKTQEAALEALDPAMADLCNSINSLIDCINQAINDGRCNFGLVDQDIRNTANILAKIFDAMKQKLQVDLYTDEIRSGNLTDAELEELAGKAAGFAGAESSDLQAVQASLTDLIESYHKAYDNANADYHRYNIFDCWFGDGDEKKERDKEIMANAQAMIKGLLGVMSALSPELASLMPEFTLAMNVIEQVLKEVKKILANPHLDLKAKQKEVLSLVVFLLSFFQIIKQDVESEKSKNSQDMSKGMLQSSQATIDDTVMNEKIKEEAERNARIMKIVMVVSEVVLGALMMAAAPGIGTALLVGMITAFEVMQTEGVVNVTGALGDAIHSQIGADILVGAAECVLTMGGGAGLDALVESGLKTAVQTAAKTALEVSEQVIEKAAAVAASMAGKAGDEAAITLAKNTLEQVAQKAAEKAAQGAAQQFMKQPFATLAQLLAKGALTKSVEEAAQQAAQEAVATAVEESATIAKLAARGVQSSERITTEIATRNANTAVSQISHQSLATVTKDAERSMGKKMAIRGLGAAIFATGNTHLPSDIAKAFGSKNDDLLETLQIIEGIIQMLALMFGSGMLTASSFEGASAYNLSRMANAMSAIPQAGEAAGAYGNYQTYLAESKAVKALSMDGSITDLLHAFVDQIQKDSSLERDLFIRDQQIEAEGTNSLAAHVNDGDQANIQMLVSAV